MKTISFRHFNSRGILPITALAASLFLPSSAKAGPLDSLTPDERAAVDKSLTVIRNCYIDLPGSVADGAFRTTPVPVNDVGIDPYFDLEGALALLATTTAPSSDDVKKVGKFLQYYAREIQQPEGVAHVRVGTLPSPPYRPVTSDIPKQYDSIDSYAGFYLLVCSRYYTITGQLPAGVQAAVETSVTAIDRAINHKKEITSVTYSNGADTNGLPIATEAYPNSLLLDCVETYAGLNESIGLFQKLGNPSKANQSALLANSIANGIGLFNKVPTDQRYGFLVDRDNKILLEENLYHDALPNLFVLSYLPSQPAQFSTIWSYLKNHPYAPDDQKTYPDLPSAPSERWLIAARRVGTAQEIATYHDSVVTNTKAFGDGTYIDRAAITILALVGGSSSGSSVALPQVQPVTVPPLISTAVDLSMGSDNEGRILWKAANDTFSLWTITGPSYKPTPDYGPLTPFTATAIGMGNDNLSRVLLNSTTGQCAVWNFQSATGNPLSSEAYGVGTHYGPTSEWTCREIAVGSDNLRRLLWVRTDGAFAIWTFNSAGVPQSSPLYGPVSPFSAQAISVGGDGLTRVLLTRNADGAAAVWTLASTDGTPTSSVLLGPASGWTVTDFSTGANNTSQVLFARSDGIFFLVRVPTSGAPSQTPIYGPLANWQAVKVGVANTGGDGLARILIRRTTGEAALWKIDASNTPLSSTAYGPVMPTVQSLQLKASSEMTRTARVSGTIQAGNSISKGEAQTQSQRVVLTVSLALDQQESLSPAHYNVLINGQIITAQSVTYSSSRLTLQLPPNSLHRGDEVMVWIDLIGVDKRAWCGGVGPLTAH